jgi:CRP-like cAMP-binding protein
MGAVMSKADDAVDLGDHGSRVIHFPDGKVIFLKGAVGDYAYVVKSGKVEIRDAGRVLEILGPGGIFGEMALIDDEERSASAVAVGPTDLVIVDHDTFGALVREVPDFAVTLMRLMAKRLRTTTAALPAAEERLAL